MRVDWVLNIQEYQFLSRERKGLHVLAQRQFSKNGQAPCGLILCGTDGCQLSTRGRDGQRWRFEG